MSLANEMKWNEMKWNEMKWNETKNVSTPRSPYVHTISRIYSLPFLVMDHNTRMEDMAGVPLLKKDVLDIYHTLHCWP